MCGEAGAERALLRARCCAREEQRAGAPQRCRGGGGGPRGTEEEQQPLRPGEGLARCCGSDEIAALRGGAAAWALPALGARDRGLRCPGQAAGAPRAEQLRWHSAGRQQNLWGAWKAELAACPGWNTAVRVQLKYPVSVR